MLVRGLYWQLGNPVVCGLHVAVDVRTWGHIQLDQGEERGCRTVGHKNEEAFFCGWTPPTENPPLPDDPALVVLPPGYKGLVNLDDDARPTNLLLAIGHQQLEHTSLK